MSSNTSTGILASQLASDEAAVVHRKVAEKCQIILETLYDSYNGYRQCADDCKDTTVKLLFQKIAENRAELITELSNVIKNDLGVEPIKSGSAIAAVHRTWIDVKAWLTDGRDKSVIITEVHRGEEILIKFYETAIEDANIISKIRDLLQQQLQTVKEQNAAVDAI